MTALDKAELADAMEALTADLGAIVPFVDRYRDRLAGVVRHILTGFGRHDLARDPDEVDGLVWDAALALAESAGAWKPEGGALPWNWARHSIQHAIARAIGNATVDVEIDVVLGGEPTQEAPGACDDVDLEHLARNHPGVDLLLRAIEATGASERDRGVHIDYRVQLILGDPSPAHTVGRIRSLRPANVRQIDRRVRVRLSDVVHTDERFAELVDCAWLTGSQRATAPWSPELATEAAA